MADKQRYPVSQLRAVRARSPPTGADVHHVASAQARGR